MGLLLNNKIDRILPNGLTLYPHQFSGAKRAYDERFTLVGYDVGVGKTLTSSAAARAFQQHHGYKVVVISPASVVTNWENETRGLFDGQIFSAGKLPKPEDFGSDKFALIVDEAHYYQDMASKRTRAMIALADASQATTLLTATPIRNYPSNLFPLLKAIRHPLGRIYAAFERDYCGGTKRGSSDLKELYELTKDSIIMGSKEDHLNLPPFKRYQKPVKFTGEALELFEDTLRESREEYRYRVDSGNISDKGFHIVLINHLRAATSRGKAPVAVRLAHKMLDRGQQVVIFTNYKETASYIEEAIDGSPHYEAHVLDGSVPRGQRQGLVDDFQEEKVQAFVMTRAGSAGLNLQRGSVFISVDRTWSPFDMIQAEGRIHRNGQRRKCYSIWLQDKVIDPWLDHMMLRKYAVAREVLYGKHDTMEGIGTPNEWAKDLSSVLFKYDDSPTLPPYGTLPYSRSGRW